MQKDEFGFDIKFHKMSTWIKHTEYECHVSSELKHSILHIQLPPILPQANKKSTWYLLSSPIYMNVIV